MEDFRSGEIDDVIIIYTSMKNSVVTETERKLLLPLKREDFAVTNAEALKAGIYQEEILILIFSLMLTNLYPRSKDIK